MTQAQLYAEIISLIAKHQMEQDNRLDKNMKEAHKSLLGAAKELFVNNDKNKTIAHLTATLTRLSKS